MPTVPNAAHYVVIGAGVHGLSTSASRAALAAGGKTVGAGGTRIVVLDKTGVGRARPASRAASFATITTSRRCAS